VPHFFVIVQTLFLFAHDGGNLASAQLVQLPIMNLGGFSKLILIPRWFLLALCLTNCIHSRSPLPTSESVWICSDCDFVSNCISLVRTPAAIQPDVEQGFLLQD